ncbi:hypothetical protein BKA62DRAFT_668559 [Auriculariales sp. MPI-PUGE-AT-0066]|nr:hypothetical protein BKA62DRAFT_668559 [Auriculariales sp. MPI-PUGE-AT-0066]
MGVNWDDPVTLYRWRRALVLFSHTGAGLYIWEFFTTLGYEVALLKGRRKLNWAACTCLHNLQLYLLPRYSIAIVGVVLLRMVNAFTDDVKCSAHELMVMQMWDHILHGFAYASNTFTQGLLYARVCALSKYNRYFVWGLGVAYVGSWGFAINGMYYADAIYVPEHYLCQPVNLHRHGINLGYQFAFDLACMISMMVLLFRMHRGGNLWKFLVRQGLVYVISLCSAYLFLVVCLLVAPGDILEMISIITALLIMTICATRMQRELVEFYDVKPGAGAVIDSSLPKPPISSHHRSVPDTMVISLGPNNDDHDSSGKSSNVHALDTELRTMRRDGKSAV